MNDIINNINEKIYDNLSKKFHITYEIPNLPLLKSNRCLSFKFTISEKHNKYMNLLLIIYGNNDNKNFSFKIAITDFRLFSNNEYISTFLRDINFRMGDENLYFNQYTKIEKFIKSTYLNKTFNVKKNVPKIDIINNIVDTISKAFNDIKKYLDNNLELYEYIFDNIFTLIVDYENKFYSVVEKCNLDKEKILNTIKYD